MPLKNNVDDREQLKRSDCKPTLLIFLLLQCKLWQLWLRTALVCSQQQRVSAYDSTADSLTNSMVIESMQLLVPRLDSGCIGTALTHALLSTYLPAVGASTHQASTFEHALGLATSNHHCHTACIALCCPSPIA
jgi:hypothetical protein